MGIHKAIKFHLELELYFTEVLSMLSRYRNNDFHLTCVEGSDSSFTFVKACIAKMIVLHYNLKLFEA